MSEQTIILPSDYRDWLISVKQRIAGARQRALLSANSEQIQLYHDIGRDILERQNREGWGTKVIDHLSADLRAAFPDMKGLSSSNLKYMRFFAQECPDRLIGQQSADQLPWFHIVTILTKLSDPILRGWYAREALQQSWPRDTLIAQIKSQLHLRQGRAVTNFNQRLPQPEAGLAAQIKASDDKPTIGLLLCKTQNRLVAEYALSGISKPIGVAEYQLVRALPKPLDTCLPSIEELETELSRELGEVNL